MKIGAAVAVLPPVAIPLLDAVGSYMQVRPTGAQPDMMTGIRLAFGTWIDSLAQGYGFSKPFNTVSGYNTDGSAVVYSTIVSAPKGLFVVTTAIGIGATIASALQSRLVKFATGVRQVRLFNRRVA
jgi:hypothetical protein